jgi:hypothetical protein
MIDVYATTGTFLELTVPKPAPKPPVPVCEVVNSSGNGIEERNEMVTEHEAAAAILVQTIFLKDGHLQGMLGEQASKSATLAAEFLKPFYAAALAMMAKVGREALESR